MDGSRQTSEKGEKKNYRFLNAVKHGVLSKKPVLPWESRAEYDQLLKECRNEYHPTGPVEMHLVEEIVGTIWRKRRLERAEQAAYMRGLHRVVDPSQYETTSRAALILVAPDNSGLGSSTIVTATEEQKEAALNDIKEAQQCAINAMNIVCTKDGTFDRAFAELSKQQQSEWRRDEECDSEYLTSRRKPKFLEHFLRRLFARYRDERYQIMHQSQIQEQVFGESIDIEALDRLARQQTRLDRKLERDLSTLLQLQNLSPKLRSLRLDTTNAE
jgi:hypothetical protein